MEAAKAKAQHYVKEFGTIRTTEHHSLMLCGQVGAGKTHLGTACSLELIRQGVPVIYMGYREEMTSLKSHVVDAEFYDRKMRGFKDAEVLFIDDYLKGKVTEADINIAYELINYRYNNNLPIILSTEKSLEELLKTDEAVGSRLIEMCRKHIIQFEGKKLNYRLYGGED